MKTIKRLFATAVVLLSFLPAFGQGVGINPSGNQPHASAGLDVDFTDKGLLIPRMTEAQRDAISGPATGLQIYNTDTDCINLWNGSGWKQSCFDCSFTAPTAGNNSPLCEGSTLNLTATFIAGATYSWTGPNGFSSSSQNPSIANATAAASGTYFLYTTVSGCTSGPVTTSVTVNATPQTPVASNDGPKCDGQTLNLSANNIVGATYSWTGPNGFSASVQNPSIANATTAASGSYSVTVLVNGCGSAAGNTNATVNALPDAGFSANPPSPIEGQSVSFTPNTGGGTYAWTFQSGSPASSSSSSPSVSWSSAGTYNVGLTVTDGNGCVNSSSSSITVTVPLDKIVFATSTYYTGNLGGLSGADAKCQTRAGAAGLSGTFKAWLSDASNSPSNRFTQSSGPYKMTNGVTIANNWADLVDGAINNLGIDRDEFGNQVGNTGVFSNTAVDGTTISTSSAATCSFYTSTSGSMSSQGATGSTVFFGSCCGNACWTRDCSSAGCSNSSFWKLYCFEQ